ncbi:hypothetical protein ABZU75_26285 [Streptosporangium sp. NPDC005286]|uniref:hypothetical protein n=1 Tax=Streptosporangium sp. NPDC005286 TaxID=3154463 RepID=UPI0033B978AE
MLGISGGPRQHAPDRPIVQDQCRQVIPPTLPSRLLFSGSAATTRAEEPITPFAAAAERLDEIVGVGMISAQELERLTGKEVTLDHSSHSQPHLPIIG